MRLIYKCLHCGAARDVANYIAMDKSQALNVAYDPDEAKYREFYKIVPYVPHECGPGIVGVAQLVAARDD